MRKLLLLLTIAALLICSTAYASPFIVCTPYPAADGVTAFVLTIDGAQVTTEAQIMTDGKARLYYDVGSIAAGTHTVTVKARNVWGDSASSVPFVFTRPVGSISAPVSIELIK